jgi:NAD(P)-dependent dehydrogenase (short-subunit alcohol dehydrogenase family)
VSRFDGKVALISAATSGIGRATALAFGREGASVVVGAGVKGFAGDAAYAATIWVVRVGDEGHITVGGISDDVVLLAAGDEIDDAVDAACREKYGRYTGYVEPMIAPQARATTLRLVPRSQAGA